MTTRNVQSNNKKWENGIRERLFSFVVDYLLGNNLDSLTFSIISKETGISRTTLYSHYGNIYDILNDLSSFYENLLLEELKTSGFEKIKDMNMLSECTSIFLKFVFQHKNYYSALDKICLKSNLLERFKEGFKNQFSCYLTIDGFHAKEYVFTYWWNGFSSVIESWVKNQFEESPEEIFDVLMFCYKHSDFKASDNPQI